MKITKNVFRLGVIDVPLRIDIHTIEAINGAKVYSVFRGRPLARGGALYNPCLYATSVWTKLGAEAR